MLQQLCGDLEQGPDSDASADAGLLDEDVAKLMGVKRKRPKEYLYIGEPWHKQSKSSSSAAPLGNIVEAAPSKSSADSAVVIHDDDDLEETEALPMRQVATGQTEAGPDLDCDIPEHSTPLPPEVQVSNVSRGWICSLGCLVDLERVCFNIRGAELRTGCRIDAKVMLRMVEPRVTVAVGEDGTVRLGWCTLDHAEAIRTARRVARMVQRCGHPDAKFLAFRQMSLQAKAQLPFPVRVGELATKWRRRVMYEPDVTGGAVFVLRNPRCTLTFYSTGTVKISAGAITPEDAHEAIRKVYPILRDFSA